MSDGNGALPEGWALAKLNELAAPEPNSMTDGPFGSKLKTAHYVDSGVRVIRLGNIGVGQFQDSVKAFITSEHFETIRKHQIFSGDLVIAALAEPVGRACAVPDYVGTAIVKADCIRFKPAESISSPFLMNWLNSPVATKTAEGMCHGIGRLRINMANMRELPIPVAPEAEQRRIVSKIESLQERSSRARRALSEVGPLLEQFRQSVLRAAFSGRLTADWRAARRMDIPVRPSNKKDSDKNVQATNLHSDRNFPATYETATELLSRIRTERRHRWEQSELAKYEAKGKQPPKNWQDKYKEPRVAKTSELPQLPEGWCWATLDELLSEPLANGRSVRDGNGTPVLRLTALRNRRIDLNETKLGDWTTEQAQKFFVHENDFLVSRGNGSIDLVGRGGIVPTPPTPTAFPDTLIRVRLTERVSIGLFALLWDSRLVRDQIESAAKTTAGIYKVSQSDLEAFVVPVVPEAEQPRIAKMLTAALHSVDEMEREAAESKSSLTQLDQSILAKAFRGELVPQDPRDEPASELLARIRTTREQAEARKKAKKKSRTKK